MGKAPSFQFYPGDWLKDPALRLCSPAARGVWIDMLCLMFESAERGVLVTNGVAWSVADAARATGGTARQVQELIDKGVARLRDDGAIYSARMVKDERIRQVRAEAGSQGGNPDLLKQNPKQTTSKTRGKRKQTREQNPTPSSSSSASACASTPCLLAGEHDDGPPGVPLDPLISAVQAWGGGCIARSAAVQACRVLLDAAEAHPITLPDGRKPDGAEVAAALVRTIQAQPNGPQPTDRSRVRQYAVAVLTRCAAEGKLPGEFAATPRPGSRPTAADRREEGNHAYDDSGLESLIERM